jgi:hypothetical protein
MRDRGRIVAGLVAFMALALLPFWHNVARGTGPAPEPKIVTQEKACVAPKQYMRENHMDLLNDWREKVVRDGVRTYRAEDGRLVRMSLSNTCMSCHPNKEQFCDRCHDYMAVSPYCWDCHIEPPKELTEVGTAVPAD